jgi:hypothetical protein
MGKLSFVREATSFSSFPGIESRIKVYRLLESQFRILFVHAPGPLVSSSIIVPTVSTNSHGLPHTLEVQKYFMDVYLIAFNLLRLKAFSCSWLSR